MILLFHDKTSDMTYIYTVYTIYMPGFVRNIHYSLCYGYIEIS